MKAFGLVLAACALGALIAHIQFRDARRAQAACEQAQYYAMRRFVACAIPVRPPVVEGLSENQARACIRAMHRAECDALEETYFTECVPAVK